jgi:hypothetical protein
MGLRGWIKRLERDARGDLASFELWDGSRYYYDPMSPELYLFCYDCLGANPPGWPEPPEVLVKVCEARDPAAALEELWSEGVADLFPYDREALISERRLVPQALVEGQDPYDEDVLDDLSEGFDNTEGGL